MRTPNFFIIGAQKSGTTYLAKVLANHPDVYLSEPKEPLFLSQPDVDSTGYQAYLETYFSGAGVQAWVGEGSTTYLQWPDALENFKAFVRGTPRFIVCLRQPTEKAVSFFIHNWRRSRYAPGTRIAQTYGMPMALSPTKTSAYAPGLTNWLDAYPRSAFCFLKFDLLKDDPASFVRAATQFLGISEPKEVLRKQVNPGFELVWRGDTLIIEDPGAPVENRPEFTRQELEELHTLMMEDVEKTELLTGLDLSNWRAFPRLDGKKLSN